MRAGRSTVSLRRLRRVRASISIADTLLHIIAARWQTSSRHCSAHSNTGLSDVTALEGHRHMLGTLAGHFAQRSPPSSLARAAAHGRRTHNARRSLGRLPADVTQRSHDDRADAGSSPAAPMLQGLIDGDALASPAPRMGAVRQRQRGRRNEDARDGAFFTR